MAYLHEDCGCIRCDGTLCGTCTCWCTPCVTADLGMTDGHTPCSACDVP